MLTGPDLAFSGPRVIFHCVAPNVSPPVIYELIKDGHGRIGRNRDFQGGQGASFPIKVTAASEGSYHCRATAGGTREISNSIKLRVVSEYRMLGSSLKLTQLTFPFSSPTVFYSLISSSTIIYQSDLWTLPPSCIRGVTHGPELWRWNGVQPFLQLVF